jgi:hypothetical protein
MMKFLCLVAERVLTGVAGFLLVFALLAGTSQYALADNQLPATAPELCGNGDPSTCAGCAIQQNCVCFAILQGCKTNCQAVGGSCAGCKCQTPPGESCACYE